MRHIWVSGVFTLVENSYCDLLGADTMHSWRLASHFSRNILLPDDESSMFLRKAGNYLPDYMVQNPKYHNRNILWRIDPLLGNDSLHTFQRTHNNRSYILCGPCYNSLIGNTIILDKRRRCFPCGPTRGYITSLFFFLFERPEFSSRVRVLREKAKSSGVQLSEFRVIIRCRVKSSKCSCISRVRLMESDSSSAVETVSGFRSKVGLVAFCWFCVVWRDYYRNCLVD
jgi:hypothetical protein